jgi:hypothetical protein
MSGFKPDAVICSCGILAVQRTTTKPGPNVGRKFYACSKGRQTNGGCNFFTWADAGPTPSPIISSLNSTSTPTKTPTRNVTAPSSSISISPPKINNKRRCEIHGQDLVRKQVLSDTANKGRWYFCCPVEFRCKSFCWDDNQEHTPYIPAQPSKLYMASNTSGFAYDVHFELVSKHIGRQLEEDGDEKSYNTKDSGVDKEHETIEYKKGEDNSDDARLLVRLPALKTPASILESSLMSIEGAEKSLFKL